MRKGFPNSGGYLLKKYCPEPTTLAPAIQEQHTLALAGQASMPEIYANANYLWWAYAGIGLLSFLGLILFIWVTNRIDARTAAAESS